MKPPKLEKHLTSRSIFAFGIAGMVASGLFLLPGLIYGKMGNWAHWVYIASGILIIPTLFSKAELATAMPRSGGCLLRSGSQSGSGRRYGSRTRDLVVFDIQKQF